ncbi:hypothetical protein [Nocardia concava]|uniref:hypothetical protein n=1 Tax=Nocardia concava TaxID=257281 RepID=UPI000319EC0C|nr:hypothetical protein [Nocardia concava]
MPSPHTRPQTRADDLYRTLCAAHSPLAAALMAAAVTRCWPAEFVSTTTLYVR